MKKNGNKKQAKEYLNKLSPSFQRKKHYYFSKSLFQDFEPNNVLLSPKKSQDELILPKKKIIPNTSHHRRTKSNSQNYIQYISNKNSNLNTSVSKLSFIFGRKELENNYNYSSVSRNKKCKNSNNNENKKTGNLLSISFSLKDFRNNIINAFSNSNLFDSKNNNKKSNIINLKNSKSILNIDNITNIEETRNTTSITHFNNSNLKYNKHINNLNTNKQNQNSKSTKYIKINQKEKDKEKENRQLYSSKNISSKIITFTNNNLAIEKKEKASPKYSLRRYIKNNNSNNYNKLNQSNNLILTKNTFINSKKYFSKEKICNINPISEFDNVNIEPIKKKKSIIKNNFTPIDKHYKIKKIKKETSPKYKKRKTKSQENNCKIGINYSNNIGKFKSVEEIHFLFVYINQKKKEYFEKNNIEKLNKNKDNQ